MLQRGRMVEKPLSIKRQVKVKRITPDHHLMPHGIAIGNCLVDTWTRPAGFEICRRVEAGSA